MHWARAAPLVAAPHRRLELQEAENIPHRNPLAEQSVVYAGHRCTFFRRDREEEPVLEPAMSTAFADRARSTVWLGR